jgi:NAD(P)-dependent dehydrogenase (short-subunit alcohol dehydrogenase family)
MPLNPRLSNWKDQCVWLIGASSGIGHATAQLLHDRGARVVVSARNAQALKSFELEHPGALGVAVDVTQKDSVAQAAQTVVAHLGRLDLVLYAAGHYRAMRATDFDLQDALKHQSVNFVGALHVLNAVLPVLIEQKTGHLSVISSVAGYRGLPMSLAYGPTKAALINLAQTLYLDLQPLGLGVSVINPGFVKTPLTAQNEFEMPALITAQQAAESILAGWAAGRFEIHFPKRLTYSLKLLSHLSDSVYFKLVRRLTGL